jgi:hypothetical protein
MSKTLEALDQLDEAREVVDNCTEDLARHSLYLLVTPVGHEDRDYHQQHIARYERLLRYWCGRVDKLEAQLPALVQAERVAEMSWMNP